MSGWDGGSLLELGALFSGKGVNLVAGCPKPTVSTDPGVRPCPFSKCIFTLGGNHLRVPQWLPGLSGAGMEDKAGNRVTDE